jgi:cysteine synthase A
MKAIAVEPVTSPVITQRKNNQELKPGKHRIQGIGAGFIPANMDTSYIDEIQRVTNERALELARRIAKTEGVPVGISSGAARGAAVEVGKRPENKDKKIVVIIPSFAERYLSTVLFEGIG